MNKGMSQTLALIVAASVLMMTALTIIMMTQGSLSNVFSSSNKQSCVSTVKSVCTIPGNGGTTHPTPESCVKAGASEGDVPGGVVSRLGDNEYECSTS